MVAGTIALIVPDVLDVNVPILTGVVKLPLSLLSCAVNIFPLLNCALTVYGTLMLFLGTNGLPLMVPVVMVCDFAPKPILNTVEMMKIKVLISERFEWSEKRKKSLFADVQRISKI